MAVLARFETLSVKLENRSGGRTFDFKDSGSIIDNAFTVLNLNHKNPEPPNTNMIVSTIIKIVMEGELNKVLMPPQAVPMTLLRGFISTFLVSLSIILAISFMTVV